MKVEMEMNKDGGDAEATITVKGTKEEIDTLFKAMYSFAMRGMGAVPIMVTSVGQQDREVPIA